jgi:histidinol dehydrogenase
VVELESELVRVLDSRSADFADQLQALTQWDTTEDDAVNRAAGQILADVRARGDAALLELTQRFDRCSADAVAALEVPRWRLEQAVASLPDLERDALMAAAARIREYHERQRDDGFEMTDSDGNRLGSRVTPLARVGVYVPGGQAAYPSTVLMTVVPARVAGVEEIIVTVPTPDGEMNELVLAALSIAGVDRVFTIGGAQAIGALAYGTPTIPRVDKIVGPGGAYVAAAKRLVFGPVGIDIIAGPSEILVIADGTTPAEWVALDLFSQAEHDAVAQAILLSPDEEYIEDVRAEMARLLPEMRREETIRASLASRGALIRTLDLDEAVAIANRIAPEHLELAVADPDTLLDAVRHAGAIFMGAHSSESLGDYAAGPSHVLPTFGTARFASPLGVYDFQKRTSIIRCSEEGAESVARIAAVLARGEGLDAHARAAEARIKGLDDNH